MRRMHRNMAVCFSLILSFQSILSSLPSDGLSGVTQAFAAAPVGTAAAENTIFEKVEIRTVQDFLAFAKSCYTQEFSEGKTFSLQQDLNLEGYQIDPIPLFCGTLEGNGYEICGIEIEQSGSNLGLFRYVGEGAVIHDLHVSGTIAAEHNSEHIGGIAGVNRGQMIACSFHGIVTGDTAVGGIAGHNDESGRITDCENHGMITGIRETGGIAGYQEGVIESCINHGAINTRPENMVESDESTDYLSLERDRLRVNFSEEKVQDVGGIAGMSEGIIADSRNLGTIGYERMGDYVGGIVGRQNGQIQSCENQANVTGRRYVGGIAGQLEPYLHFLYETDTLDDLEKQMDELSDIGDAVSDTLDQTTDQTFDHMDEVDRLMKEIRDIAKEHKNDQKEKREVFREESNDHLDAIQEVLDNLELDIGSRDARNAMSRITRNVKRSKELLKEMGGVHTEIGTPSDWEEAQLYDQLGQDFWIENEDWGAAAEDIAEAAAEEILYHYGIAKELAACAGQIMEDAEIVIFKGSADIEDDVQDIMDDLDSLRCESSEQLSLSREYLDQLIDDLDVMDDDLSARLDDLTDQSDDISDILKDGKNSLQAEKEQLNDLLDRVNQILKDGKKRVRDHADKILDDEDFFDDISDDTWQEFSDGMIWQCSNSGSIMGESESGGIAGNIGVKVLEDLKDRIAEDENRTLNVFKETKAVVLQCRNEGEVCARYDYAGGISGNMTLGLVRSCENYGNISSEDGDYVGGVAGKSTNVIRSSYSMCSVSGDEYVGGIAGAAMDLYDNVAMAEVKAESPDRLGVIAGWSDDDGVIAGNVYVDEGIGAVNGITYTAQANGVSYKELLELPELPSAFYQMNIRFFCDGELVDSMVCDYGDSLSYEQFPKLPNREGYYCEWEINSLDRVINNVQIHAIYEPFLTVISSEEEPLARMLAEGNFYPGARAEVHQLEPESIQSLEMDSRYYKADHFQYEVRNADDSLYEGELVIHLLAENYPENAGVGVLQEDGSVSKVQSRRDGKYLVFRGNGSGTVIVIKPIPAFRILAGIVGILLVVGIVWLKKRRKKS
ncbi:MAG: hypothetical protein ACI39W_00555 [Brotaphodocola sp.]